MRFLLFALLAVLTAASKRAVRRYRYAGGRRRVVAPAPRRRRGARLEDPFGLLDKQWGEAIKAMARRREMTA